MRFIALVLLAAISFIGAVAGALALTGNLTKENILEIVKPQPKETTAAETTEDDVGPLSRALQKREAELDKRERELDKQEERLDQRLAELKALREEIAQIRKQIQTALEKQDAERDKRMQDVADSLAEMDPANAAQTIEQWPTEDAAVALRLIKERERGKILDEMDPEKAGLVLRSLQQPAF